MIVIFKYFIFINDFKNIIKSYFFHFFYFYIICDFYIKFLYKIDILEIILNNKYFFYLFIHLNEIYNYIII